jgi:hypothetical protein
MHEEERLVLPRNTISLKEKRHLSRTIQDRFTQETHVYPGQLGFLEKRRLYSYHTRHYLRRRTWRYFRKLTFQAPAQYVPAICFALRRYRRRPAQPENLLDSWGLMQPAFDAMTPSSRRRLRPQAGPR